MEELQENQRSLEGQSDQLIMSYEEIRNENIRLMMEQETQNNLIQELQIMLTDLPEVAGLEEKMNALEQKHAQEMLELDREMNALRAEDAQQMLKCRRETNALIVEYVQVMQERDREMRAREMNASALNEYHARDVGLPRRDGQPHGDT